MRRKGGCGRSGQEKMASRQGIRLADVCDEGALKQAIEDNAPVSIWGRRVCVRALRGKGPPP